MRLPFYPTKTRLAHALVALAGLGLPGLSGCGDDDAPAAPVGTPDDDGGPGEEGGTIDPTFDADVPPPVDPPDAGRELPGDPPEELAEESCAVDTNKLFTLATSMEAARPTQLAVDLAASEFGLVYIGPSEECVDAVYAGFLSGPTRSGEPPSELLISEECTTVAHASIAHNGEQWLFAIADGRGGSIDLYTLRSDGENVSAGMRITDTPAQERETALAAIDPDVTLVAWVDRDAVTGDQTLGARVLDGNGAPTGDVVTLEEGEGWTYAGLTLAPIGTDFVGLGYRRSNVDGVSEMVLEVLDVATGERNRDPWVLSESAGGAGTIDLATDPLGGAVMYSLGEGTSQQLWLQMLDAAGGPAPVMSGGQIGGPSPPKRIVGPPMDATDASLAKMPAGYGVAYRVLPRDGSTPRIRVHFLDRFGNLIGFHSDVALATLEGGRTAFEAAYDGRMLVGWSDTDENGENALIAGMLPCSD